MATWQFDSHLLPRSRLVNASGAIPTSVEQSAIDQEDWFSGLEFSPQIEKQIETLAPEISSWSKNIRIWGQDEGHRIDVLYKENQIVTIFVRISAQDEPSRFISGLAELCRCFDFVLITETMRVLPPNADLIEQEMANSPAFKFVQSITRNA